MDGSEFVSNLDADAAQPAPTLLASSLLDLELERAAQIEVIPELHTGRKDVDTQLNNLWNGSGVLGIAGLREGMAEEVVKALILSHLKSLHLMPPPPLDNPADSTPPPMTYLVTLPNALVLSPISLAEHFPPSSNSASSSPLDTVLYLRPLDLLGLLECVGEVNDSIFSPSTGATHVPRAVRSIVVISQPDSVISSHLSTHNLTSTAALTAQLLRTLNHLSSSGVKVLVTTSVLTSYLPRNEFPISAFTPEKSANEIVGLTKLGRRSVLGRMLEGEAGVGRWVLVHERDERSIVEAVKAPPGEKLGWSIWD